MTSKRAYIRTSRGLSDLYGQALKSIQAGRHAEAHTLLIQLARMDSYNPTIWFLLVWTAPNPQVAARCARVYSRLDPEKTLAQDGLLWNEGAWSDTTLVDDPELDLPKTVHLEQQVSRELPRAPGAGDVSTPREAVDVDLIGTTATPLKWILIVYLLLITAAEWMTTFIDPKFGLVIHGGLLSAILLHSAIGSDKGGQKFLITLALAPLIRLTSLSMPLVVFEFNYWYAIIGAPLLLTSFIVLRLTGFKPSDVGFSIHKVPLQILVGLSGFGLGWVEYQILKPEALVPSWSFSQIWQPILILLVFTGFLEEFIFRGLMQRAATGLGQIFGILYISLLFASLHIGYRSLIDIVFVFAVGLYFALVVRRTGSIWGVTLAHGLTNIALFIIIPLN